MNTQKNLKEHSKLKLYKCYPSCEVLYILAKLIPNNNDCNQFRPVQIVKINIR